jgi:valyl-tRNA synthetase
VHPDDERYTRIVGGTVLVPLVDRPVPVIADRYADRKFGSGALKVTPAHDPNDWNLGVAHNLALIQVMDGNGVMTAEAGPYAGLSREECRARIVEELRAGGRLVREEELEHNVGVCYRCKTVIEPNVSTQWFVASTRLAPQARAAVPEQIKIFPESWVKTYYNWLDNIRDWCISRQIWWGHRIPAWTCAACGELVVAETDPPACPKCGGSLEQDPDVLDTWFSSSLWPFSTMGWPEKTPDLENFYPTSVLVTGFDILFFWVARMIMMGQAIMGQVPFRAVYLHALVRDRHGRKMSKTQGNGIDPMEMIGKYGADSLRFTLTAFAAMGRDIRMSEDRIEGYRHFINKLWNASRFALMNLDETPPPAADPAQADGLHHRWILHRLEEVKAETDAAISAYRFNDAAQSLYKFLWSEFCDWYLELIKGDMREEGPGKKQAQHTLYTVLRELLLLLHPIVPFVTAQIWQALPGQQDSDIATLPGPPPRPACLRPDDADAMVFLQETISAIRTIRAELGINPSYRLTVLLRPADPGQAALLERGRAWLTSLARLENLAVQADGRAPKAAASNVVRGCEVIVHLSGAVDFQAELARLEKELGKTQKELAGLEAKLGNALFLDKAPEAVVRQERDRAADLADKRSKMLALQNRFRSAFTEL